MIFLLRLPCSSPYKFDIWRQILICLGITRAAGSRRYGLRPTENSSLDQGEEAIHDANSTTDFGVDKINSQPPAMIVKCVLLITQFGSPSSWWPPSENLIRCCVLGMILTAPPPNKIWCNLAFKLRIDMLNIQLLKKELLTASYKNNFDLWPRWDIWLCNIFSDGFSHKPSILLKLIYNEPAGWAKTSALIPL